MPTAIMSDVWLQKRTACRLHVKIGVHFFRAAVTSHSIGRCFGALVNSCLLFGSVCRLVMCGLVDEMVVHNIDFVYPNIYWRSRRSCGIRCKSVAARLLGSWVWFPLTARMFVPCACCELCSGFCDELITGPGKSSFIMKFYTSCLDE